MPDLDEVFEYRFTPLDPIRGDHIDPPTMAIYETLLTKGPDGRPRPGLATSWQVSDDGLTWLLRLRDGARFHTGRTCDAAAVVEALELCRWGEGFPRQVWYWDPVDNVTARDDTTVVFRLQQPTPRLPVLLWGTHTAVVNAHSWSRLGADFGVTLADGTGPYRMRSYRPDEVVAERVDARPGAPTVLRWRSVPDDEEREAIAARGTADIVRQVPRLRPGRTAGWSVQRQPENSQFYLALNFADPRFSTALVRRCIDAFVDRDELLQRALAGEGDARRSPVPAADEFADAYDPRDVPAMSRSEAREALRSLGWLPGPDGVLTRDGVTMHVETVAQDTEVCRRIAEGLASALRDVGVALHFRFEELFGPFYRAVEEGPSAFLNKWLWSDAMEAVYGFSRTDCIEPAGGNWQSASCPVVDEAFDDFGRARTDADLRAASAALQRDFMLELPYLPLVSPVETLATGPAVGGLRLTPRTLYPTYDAVVVSR